MAWGSVANIKGPTGATGSTGATGPAPAGTGAVVVNSGTPAVVAPSTAGNLLVSNGSQWVSQTPQKTPWCPEANICQGALAVGYNDLPGGFAVEPGINANGVTLQAVWLRMGTIGATFAASSVFDVYVGTATSQGTLAVSITMAAAATNQIATLGTPVSMAANAVVRIYCSTAGAAVTGPIHAQLRGVYNG